jgi:hypothetical protein
VAGLRCTRSSTPFGSRVALSIAQRITSVLAGPPTCGPTWQEAASNSGRARGLPTSPSPVSCAGA